MGKRGLKPLFLDIAYPNEQCTGDDKYSSTDLRKKIKLKKIH
jgi:hypothetical protein